MAAQANFAHWRQARAVIAEVAESISGFGEIARGLGVRDDSIRLIFADALHLSSYPDCEQVASFDDRKFARWADWSRRLLFCRLRHPRGIVTLLETMLM
ncbi:hypothetical protein CCR96_09655 [Halochromatium roseum]|nr:hypothetical protein [Halochromatium roseum]